ncbi:hypothetical protein PTSG_03810 [Salpingoeca rosetta]|uniref:Anaphase-promoting complex subunit 4 WD40 domain-containing protein n=1 Tax=Salpingoeca rosetta (strain ATCC 50818 / BSB-021) TaxID=946362 RepID=F2U5G3_SALR5|nr:uncharacterized protein PTSG_03810 [Salpingoeca rosetta]EGD83179.1 hypothetical protein PTSG_03810 [Salpingoeca rosetta]|eukprot:XP_004995543.1 hypothetical protein PTSG_03810 [Salpingoeca rosetta]
MMMRRSSGVGVGGGGGGGRGGVGRTMVGTRDEELCELNADIQPVPTEELACRVTLRNPVIIDHKNTARHARSLNALDEHMHHTTTEPLISRIWNKVTSLLTPTPMETKLVAPKSIVQGAHAHPHCQLCAIARRDGTVEIRNTESSVIDVVSPYEVTLSIRRDKTITSLAWCPSRKDVLCVATQKEVLLWTLGDTSTACQYTPVGSGGAFAVCWSPCGVYLLIAPVTGGLLLCDTATMTMLRVCARELFRFVSWSPRGRRVLAATKARHFMTFDVDDGWKASRWQASMGYIASACWSHDDTYLLFAVRGDPTVHCLQFYSAMMPPIGEAFNVWKDPNYTDGAPVSVVGLAWDLNSQRLIVMTETEDGVPTPELLVCQTKLGGHVPQVTRSSVIPAPTGGDGSPYAPQELSFTTARLPDPVPMLFVVWHRPTDCRLKAYPFFYQPWN